MDRQEYQEIIDGIRKGYANGDYERVIMFAREISPKKIKETRIIEMVADAYEYTGKLGLARQTLEVAYDRMQGGKQIAYKLAEQSIRLKDIDGAVRYYEDFCRVAPNDTRKYILKYEIATAGGLTIYDRIKILEEYNQKEVDEEALYELARLYHEAGMGDQCAATVDELTTWFADGEYIKKGLELKFAHTPLSKKQQAMYESIMGEYMDPDEFLQQPEQPPMDNPFDEEAEEFANRYLNGTLDDTKPIDTAAVAEAAAEAEAREIAATKKLSLNESVAFATMAANMANEAQAAKAYEIQKPEPEPEKTPLERMVEEPKSNVPEVGGYYTRRTAEASDGSLNLNINMDDEYNVDGQMSIDDMFQSYANNIENNSENKAAVEKVEAERLRQIREAVESSIVATPLMDIDDEPEEVKVPEEPEMAVEAETVEAHIPKTAQETIPGDMTIESMLAAMGETIEDEVVPVPAPAPVPVVEPEPVAPVAETTPAVEPKPAAPVAEPEPVQEAVPEVKSEPEAPKAEAEPKVEPVPVVVKTVEKKPKVKAVDPKTVAVAAEAPKKEIPAEEVAIAAGAAVVGVAAAEGIKEAKEEYVFTSTMEDNSSLDLAVDDIMSELPVADIPKAKEEPVVEAKPVTQDTFELESAMDDIMSELPLDDFKKKDEPEEIAGLDDIGDFLTGEFLAVESAAETAEEKPVEAVIDEPVAEPAAEAKPADEPVAEAVETEPVIAEAAAVESPAAEEPVAEAAPVKEDFELESAMDDIMSELPLDDFTKKEEPEEIAGLDDIGDFLAGEFLAVESAAETAEEKPVEAVIDEPAVGPEVEAKPAEEPVAEAIAAEQVIAEAIAAEPVIAEAIAAEKPATEEPAAEAVAAGVAGAAVAATAAVAADTAEIKSEPEEVAGLDDIGDFLAGEFVAETVEEKPLETVSPEPAAEQPETAGLDDIGDFLADEFVAEAVEEKPVKAVREEPLYPYKRYRITDEIHEDMAEFLLADGMQENIEDAISNILYIKKNGNINGGNLIVTGDAKSGKTFLAITVVKAVTQELGDGNGRVAKVQSTSINGKNIEKIFQKVEGNDIIIENVGNLDESTLLGILDAMKSGIAKNMVIFEGNVLAIETMINNHPEIEDLFKNRIDINELTISQWADVACDYANRKGYVINDMALLALHAKIDEINSPMMRFGYEEAINIIDRAIDNARKRGNGKLFSTFKRDSSGRMELIESDFEK